MKIISDLGWQDSVVDTSRPYQKLYANHQTTSPKTSRYLEPAKTSALKYYYFLSSLFTTLGWLKIFEAKTRKPPRVLERKQNSMSSAILPLVLRKGHPLLY